jgi:hypothetical protein
MDLAKSSYASIDFEYEVFKERAKKREQELLDCLKEVREASVDNDSNGKLHDLQNELKRLEVVCLGKVERNHT